MNETNVDEMKELVDDGIEQVADPAETLSDTSESENGSEVPGGENEVVISVGEETTPEPEEESPVIRTIRKSNRELKKKNRELENQLRAFVTPKAETLGPKPKLEDNDYNEDVYESKLLEWVDKKKRLDAEEKARLDEQENQAKAWQETMQSYEKAKTSLRVKDYQEAEEVIIEKLSQTQQGVILEGAEARAVPFFYYLGKVKPEEVERLSKIKSPIKFAWAAAQLEAKLKVSERQAPPPPERIINGTARGSSADSTLEKLRAEAERTGDYTKVYKYKKQRGI